MRIPEYIQQPALLIDIDEARERVKRLTETIESALSLIRQDMTKVAVLILEAALEDRHGL